MNLKFKTTNRITAIISYQSETLAIFSDEVSPTHIKCLTVIEGADKHEIWKQAKQLAIETAATTRFQPIIAVISPSNTIEIKSLSPVKPSNESYV
jgi:hypothetical protein